MFEVRYPKRFTQHRYLRIAVPVEEHSASKHKERIYHSKHNIARILPNTLFQSLSPFASMSALTGEGRPTIAYISAITLKEPVSSNRPIVVLDLTPECLVLLPLLLLSYNLQLH